MVFIYYVDIYLPHQIKSNAIKLNNSLYIPCGKEFPSSNGRRKCGKRPLFCRQKTVTVNNFGNRGRTTPGN